MDKKQVNFEDISPAGKRVMIALDVIIKLKTNQFVAKAQTWLASINDHEFISNKDVKESRQLKSILNDLTKPDDPNCQACALGGCFVAAVDLFNDITADDVADGPVDGLWIERMSDYLGKFFEKDQLRLIEMAFEFGHGGFRPLNDEDRCASSMYWNAKDPETRMIAIMGNIIENKGEFKVPVSDVLVELYHNEVSDYEPEEDEEDDDDGYDDDLYEDDEE